MNSETQKLLKEVADRFPIGSEYDADASVPFKRIVSAIEINGDCDGPACVSVFIRSRIFPIGTGQGAIRQKIFEVELPVAMLDMDYELAQGESFDYSRWSQLGTLTFAKQQKLLRDANELFGYTKWVFGRQELDGAVTLYDADNGHGGDMLLIGYFVNTCNSIFSWEMTH